jgi:nucleotide sugar dehydrogenase
VGSAKFKVIKIKKERELKKICVVGLGEIGLPTAKYILNRGLEVWGYDISDAAIEKAKRQGILHASSKWNDIPSADIYIVCVSTFWENNTINLNPVFDCCKKISEKANKSTLVSIESTIVPGTSKKLFTNIFNCKTNIVHVPHRYWGKEPEKYGVNQLRVIGAINPESLEAGLTFYRTLLDIQMHIVSTIEIAEMCKITENSHRYLQIAFAEELKMICEEIGINFEELRKACNTKWNVDIPEAIEGIGGHCLPKDIRYVISMAPINSLLLKSAIALDKKYRAWITKSRR